MNGMRRAYDVKSWRSEWERYIVRSEDHEMEIITVTYLDRQISQ